MIRAFLTAGDTRHGFTLLEVMVAMAIMAIGLTAVLGSHSQSVSLASEARFGTTAPLLAQGKMAELEVEAPEDLGDNSGDFGEEFPGYLWEVKVSDAVFDTPEGASRHLKRIDVIVVWGERRVYEFLLTRYRFVPQS